MVGKNVASFMGAWVETDKTPILSDLREVASFMGAWVETLGKIMANANDF